MFPFPLLQIRHRYKDFGKQRLKKKYTKWIKRIFLFLLSSSSGGGAAPIIAASIIEGAELAAKTKDEKKAIIDILSIAVKSLSQK